MILRVIGNTELCGCGGADNCRVSVGTVPVIFWIPPSAVGMEKLTSYFPEVVDKLVFGLGEL